MQTAARPHKHFKIDFTPKLSPQQHRDLMKFIFSYLGGPGEAYVESRDIKVS